MLIKLKSSNSGHQKQKCIEPNLINKSISSLNVYDSTDSADDYGYAATIQTIFGLFASQFEYLEAAINASYKLNKRRYEHLDNSCNKSIN